jgi:SAM-dependent methyltransferase
MTWTPPTPEERRVFWDTRYATEGFVFGVEPNRFVAEYLADLPPCRALDLGSGQGRNAVWLARQGHDVTAVDLSAVARGQAVALAAELGVDAEFVAADLTTWEPPAGAFDLVLLAYLQLIPEQRAMVHATAVRALAPGGVVFLIAHHLDNLELGMGGPQSPQVLFTEEHLAADFVDLDIERLGQVGRPVEHDGVEGEAIDVLMIARRPPE